MTTLKIFALLLALVFSCAFAKKNVPFTGNFADLPTITGAHVVGGGFNARTGQYGLSQVLTYTYNYNQTWQSPSTNIIYKVPDQLMLAEDSQTDAKVVLSLTTSFQMYLHFYFSVNVFYGLIPLPGAFAAFVKAKEIADAQGMLVGNTTYVGWSTFNTKYYSLDMAPAYMLKPSNMFQLAVEGLPSTFTNPTDLAKYQQFVTSYGTHYVCFADMGGTMHSSNYISSKIALDMSLSLTASQMVAFFALSFFSIFTAGFKTKGDIQIQAWFQQSSIFKTYFYGGNVAYQSNNTMDQWIASIPDNAAMLNRTLCPLSMLIKDSTKSASMAAYIEQYVNAPPTLEEIEEQEALFERLLKEN